MKLFYIILITFVFYSNVFTLKINNLECQPQSYFCNVKDKITCCKGLFCNTKNSKAYYGFCDVI